MANKEVKQCRFYVDLLTYYHAIGYNEYINSDVVKYLYTDPALPQTNNALDSNFEINMSHEYTTDKFASVPRFECNFIGLLNHNFADLKRYADEIIINLSVLKEDGDASDINTTDHNNLTMSNGINWSSSTITSGGINFSPDYNGWSMIHLDNFNTVFPDQKLKSLSITYTPKDEYNSESTWPYLQTNSQLQLGSWFVGRYFDTPYSPNLNLTLKREFDGIESTQSTMGRTHVNIKYDSVQQWTQYLDPDNLINTDGKVNTIHIPSMEFTGSGDIEQTNGYLHGDFYQQQVAKGKNGRKGKRVWNLAFDYLSDTEIFIDKEYSTNLLNNPETNKYSPQIDDTSFQWVWTHTLGGNLPFIFCPDKNLITSDDEMIAENMAICKFDNKTLQVRQIAPNLYNISVVIREL